MTGFGMPVRVVLLLAALVTVLFSLSIILSAYDTPTGDPGSKVGPGAYSTSALGYAGLYDLLGRLGWSLRRDDLSKGISGAGVVVVAEPAHRTDASGIASAIGQKTGVLLVLPKRKGIPAPDRSNWVEAVECLPLRKPMDILAAFAIEGEVVRRRGEALWLKNDLAVTPSPTELLQLVQSEDLLPVVATKDGILVGQIKRKGRNIWVLSDPDLMANHAIGDGDNASFMIALLSLVRGPAKHIPLVFDESIHGYRQHDDQPLRLLFDFPFVIATWLALASALLLVLAGAHRFGQPDRPRPDDQFGKDQLIDNSARLMAYSGHYAYVIHHYQGMLIRSTAEALHAPQRLASPELAAWLDNIARSRGLEQSCARILQDMAMAGEGQNAFSRQLRSVMALYRWRRELLSRQPQTARGIVRRGTIPKATTTTHEKRNTSARRKTGIWK